MTEQEKMLYVVRGVIAGLDEQSRQQVEECAQKIRAVMAEYDENGLGLMAMSLVGSEKAAEP